MSEPLFCISGTGVIDSSALVGSVFKSQHVMLILYIQAPTFDSWIHSEFQLSNPILIGSRYGSSNQVPCIHSGELNYVPADSLGSLGEVPELG